MLFFQKDQLFQETLSGVFLQCFRNLFFN